MGSSRTAPLDLPVVAAVSPGLPATFVVPLDGSDRSLRAVPIAASFAERFGADVVAVTTPTTTDADDRLAPPVWLRDLAGDDHYRRLRVVVVDDNPVNAVSMQVAANHDSVVCMATHSRGAIGTMALGSVAQDVVREVGVPVLLVGRHCRRGHVRLGTDRRVPRRIVCGRCHPDPRPGVGPSPGPAHRGRAGAPPARRPHRGGPHSCGPPGTRSPRARRPCRGRRELVSGRGDPRPRARDRRVDDRAQHPWTYRHGADGVGKRGVLGNPRESVSGAHRSPAPPRARNSSGSSLMTTRVLIVYSTSEGQTARIAEPDRRPVAASRQHRGRAQRRNRTGARGVRRHRRR